ncbi:MAG: hypothetical protein ACXVWT_27510 [Solirubrobacteraceae bacterium]
MPRGIPRRQIREGIADWLIVFGALLLLLSLFLTWSHQFSNSFVQEVGADQLRGIPRDPTAWQVYSIADVLLALLAAALVVAALVAGRGARISALVAAALALVFTIHASNVAPTNGVNIAAPDAGVAHLMPSTATSGGGEVLAIVGLALSFTAD